MDIKDFKAGKYISHLGYGYFLPEKISKPWRISSPDIINLLSEADRLLGELNAFSQLIPDVDFFIKMHVSKEAVTSGRIEGTRTEMEEVFLTKEDIEPEKRDDWQEIQNYIQALHYAINELENIPLNNRLLKNTHKILLQGVRGKHKLPGEFRRSQNWIGATLKDAVYVPPHHAEVPELMSDLEKFLHDETLQVPGLIKIGMAHYQFETVHPFLDGNGRLGRLLITLFLVDKGLLQKPALYISDFFDRHRMLYFDHLMRVRQFNDMEAWLKFFLTGIIETSRSSIDVFKNILKLKADIEQNQLPGLGKKVKKANELLRILFENPVITSAEVARKMQIAPSTANRLLADFVRLGILEETTGFKRNRKFTFKKYLDLFQK